MGKPDAERQVNQRLCDAASRGDAARLEELLRGGANPGGHFDPVEARRWLESLMESWLRRIRRSIHLLEGAGPPPELSS